MTARQTDTQDRLRDAIGDAFEPMPADVRTAMRHRVLVATSYDAAPGRIRQAFARSAAVFTTVVVLMTGTSFAAAGAVPGDALYPLKRAVEEAHVVLAPGGPEEALVEQTQTRAEEVRRLMEMDAPEAMIDEAALGFGQAAARAIEQAQSPEDAAKTVRRIEDAFSEQPKGVQERVEDVVPGSVSGAPQAPNETVPGVQGPGSGAGSSGSGNDSAPQPGESQGEKP